MMVQPVIEAAINVFCTARERAMSLWRLTGPSLFLALAAAAPATGWTQNDQERVAVTFPVQSEPSFYVRLEVNHQTRSYREGDGLTIRAVSEADCYAYVIYHQADGKSFQVFPNAQQPVHRLKARQAVHIPAEDDLFRWQVSPPFGKERITLLCTKEPIDILQLERLRSKRFNPISAEQLKGVALELGKERPSAWAADEVEILTYPLSQPLREGKSRRVGVFFGVANYQFHVEAEAAGGRGLNLTTCHRDARVLRDLMQEVGELEESKVYTNEQATRANIEQATTSWLPSITQPGDTVFIYFSGHGAQSPDDHGEETDGRDELLIPYDYVSLPIAEELVRRAQNGTLEPRQTARAAQAVEIIRRAGSTAAAQALARETGITDDLFGHWMQRLSGRHVVVILDICHAGGFASVEKDLTGKKALQFDFAGGETKRLKDLGHDGITLLTACGAQETAAVRREDDLSVMTYYLVEAIRGAPAQLSLDQAFEHCRGGMRDYFQNLAAQAQSAGKPQPPGHVPQLRAEPRNRIWLKP